MNSHRNQPLLGAVVNAFESSIAPLSLAEKSWDNVGVLVEAPFPRQHASRVFLCIDLVDDVLQEALSDEDVGVIVAYHPTLFKSMRRLTLDDEKQAIALRAAAMGVSIFSPHTALDVARFGINDWLADAFASVCTAPATAITPSKVEPTDTGAADAHKGAGYGRHVELTRPMPLAVLIQLIKTHLQLSHVRVAKPRKNDTDMLISSIAICAGSGSSLAGVAQADLILTGEMDHHNVLSFMHAGSAVVLCEHSNTERGYLKERLQPRLESLLRTSLSDASVITSKVDAEYLQIV